MCPITIEVRNMRKVQAEAERVIRELKGPRILEFMKRVVLIVLRGAKENAPVDTGLLRSSLIPEVRLEQGDVLGVIGSNVVYAPYQEFGTSLMQGPTVGGTQLVGSSKGTGSEDVDIPNFGKPRRLHYIQRAIDSNLAAIKHVLEIGITSILRGAK